MSPTELTQAGPVQNRAAGDDPKEACVRSIRIMADGDLSEFEALIHPEAANREARKELPAARGRGPAAFYATAPWLRGAFSDMHRESHEVAADGDLVAVHSTLSARHTGPFVTCDDAGAVAQVMPPTGKTFSATQTRWFRTLTARSSSPGPTVTTSRWPSRQAGFRPASRT